MIGSLIGKPQPLSSNSIILNVNGVGYKVYLPASLQIKVLSQTSTTLYIHTHVRDDTLDLYGFTSLEDLNLFQLIINISGIGPKTAVVLIDKGVPAITSAVAKADVDFFTTIPRLGKKNAQKIIIELKPKLGDIEALDLTAESPETKQALEALTGLGFSQKEARLALRQVSEPGDTLEVKITKAIKHLGKNRK